jgi:hypothetical protein
MPAAVGELLPGRGAVEPLDGVQAPAQVAGDLPQSSPLGAQPVDQRVVPPGALGVLPGGVRLPGVLWFRQGRALLLRGGPDIRPAGVGPLAAYPFGFESALSRAGRSLDPRLEFSPEVASGNGAAWRSRLAGAS